MTRPAGPSSRDEEFTAFVARTGTALRRYAYVLTGDHGLADDLLQASLIKVYLSWDKVADEAARSAYARRIMTRTQVSWWRRPARRESAAERLPEQALPGGTDQVEDRDQVWRLLSTLPPRQRAVVVLRFYEDLAEADIADVLGCSVGSVKSQLSRGLARLRAVDQSESNPMGVAR